VGEKGKAELLTFPREEMARGDGSHDFNNTVVLPFEPTFQRFDFSQVMPENGEMSNMNFQKTPLFRSAFQRAT